MHLSLQVVLKKISHDQLGFFDRVGRPAHKQNRYTTSEVLRLLRHQFELVGHTPKLWKRTRFHLSHRPAEVDLHRGFSEAHITGNLCAEPTVRHLNHDVVRKHFWFRSLRMTSSFAIHWAAAPRLSRQQWISSHRLDGRSSSAERPLDPGRDAYARPGGRRLIG
jgi:hypothetical protein